MLKAIYRRKRVKNIGYSSAAPFSAESFIEWEQAYSVLNYNKDGLNVLCAFQTSALSILFVASVAGILAIVVIGRGIGQSCTESAIVIIFALSTASFLLPIVIYAFLASEFDSKASYALHDLDNLSKNLRQRRDFAYTSWQASNSRVLKQWQEQRALDRDQPRQQRSLTMNPMYDSSEYSQRDMLFTVVTPEHFESLTASMSNSLTPVRCAAAQAQFSTIDQYRTHKRSLPCCPNLSVI